MEPDSWPTDGAVAAERLRDVIDELDGSNEDDRLALLSDLLCSAWVSIPAQNQ
jgi:hypothetical protein